MSRSRANSGNSQERSSFGGVLQDIDKAFRWLQLTQDYADATDDDLASVLEIPENNLVSPQFARQYQERKRRLLADMLNQLPADQQAALENRIAAKVEEAALSAAAAKALEALLKDPEKWEEPPEAFLEFFRKKERALGETLFERFRTNRWRRAFQRVPRGEGAFRRLLWNLQKVDPMFLDIEDDLVDTAMQKWREAMYAEPRGAKRINQRTYDD